MARSRVKRHRGPVPRFFPLIPLISCSIIVCVSTYFSFFLLLLFFFHRRFISSPFEWFRTRRTCPSIIIIDTSETFDFTIAKYRFSVKLCFLSFIYRDLLRFYSLFTPSSISTILFPSFAFFCTLYVLCEVAFVLVCMTKYILCSVIATDGVMGRASVDRSRKDSIQWQ